MLKGFGQFIARGNAIDLAVAVVMGAAFGSVVTALVKDLITPLIAALVGKPDFSTLSFAINGSRFPVGDFINALVAFVLVALAVYYFVVVPMNAITARIRPVADEPPKLRECPACLSEVPLGATRCKYCTGTLVAV